MEKFTETFPKLLKQHRNAKGWSQLDLAERCGYRYKENIGQLERGKRKPSIALLWKLCVALDCQPNDLLIEKSPSTDEA